MRYLVCTCLDESPEPYCRRLFPSGVVPGSQQDQTVCSCDSACRKDTFSATAFGAEGNDVHMCVYLYKTRINMHIHLRLHLHILKHIHTVDGRHPAPLGNRGKPWFVGIYRGIIIPEFLRWCRISSIHSIIIYIYIQIYIHIYRYVYM